MHLPEPFEHESSPDSAYAKELRRGFPGPALFARSRADLPGVSPEARTRARVFQLALGLLAIAAAVKLIVLDSVPPGRVARDGLTGLKNRGAFDDDFPRLWQQAMRDRRSLALLLIDVDHFKAYNDRYGHQAGDRALRHAVPVVQRFARRPLDIAARYGGEEFLLALYDLGAEHVREIAGSSARAFSLWGSSMTIHRRAS